MMLAWRKGNSVGRMILLDPVFPWPSLHYGRNALRAYGTRQNERRNRLGDEGPYRMPLGIRSAVKETGDAMLVVWPCDGREGPRHWTDDDSVWRTELPDLADFVAEDLMCGVVLKWMPGGEPFCREQSDASLRDRQGFYGWRKGEHEPVESVMLTRMRDGLLKLIDEQEGVT
jgi:hypothetical protein